MITGSSSKQDADSPGNKQGSDAKEDKNNTSNKPSSSNSSSWLRLKDPRIVRVSRAFGGKDRHSKVCTVRGLRDRRVRLSVPTAIQLYDLQDRLGLSQPSKVVDWLLNAAKDEIDELPPLQMPPLGFTRNHNQESGVIITSTSDSGKEGLKINQNVDWNEARSSLWNLDANWRGKSKEVEVVATQNDHGKEENSQSNMSFLNIGHHSMAPYGSLYQWEPNSSTTFPLSHLGSSRGFMSQLEDVRHNNMSLPSTLSLSSGSQVFVCPPGSTTQPYFPLEIDPRQINHFQMLSSSQNNLLPNSSLYSIGQSMRPFHFSMSAPPRPPPPVQSQNSSGSEQNKDQEHHHFPYT